MKTQKNTGRGVDDFWREYEEKNGEKVLARCMGQYVSGWDEFGDMSAQPLWGLIIATSGGFRFHHFPQANWLTGMLFSGSVTNAPKEKTIFIAGEKIISAELRRETKWYKKIFSQNVPCLLICYRDETGTEKKLVLNADDKTDDLINAVLKQTFISRHIILYHQQ